MDFDLETDTQAYNRRFRETIAAREATAFRNFLKVMVIFLVGLFFITRFIAYPISEVSPVAADVLAFALGIALLLILLKIALSVTRG